MPPERERLLLTLSLEFSSAREMLAASAAIIRYLKARFDADSVIQESSVDASEFAKGQMFLEKNGELYFQLLASMPIVYKISGAKGPKLDAFETETVTKICTFFRENQQMVADLRGQTYTDDLTGLYNQRYLEIILDRELSLAKRNESIFSVLFLDLDHFKNVNDSHGHLIGSRLLYEVGVEIKKTLRESDITFRYGGDEFVMILSHTNLEDAMFVAERVRVQIEKKRFLVKDGMEIRLTASIGVANVPMHAETKQEILKAADEALYGVKKAVRNKVIAAAITMKR